VRGNGEGWVQGAGGLATEGGERDSDKESVRFFNIAKGSLSTHLWPILGSFS
jgi:hypothetical protein